MLVAEAQIVLKGVAPVLTDAKAGEHELQLLAAGYVDVV